MRIIPGEMALDGSIWQLKKVSHIVYVIDNKKHPDYTPNIRMIMPEFIHKETGEVNVCLPIKNIK